MIFVGSLNFIPELNRRSFRCVVVPRPCANRESFELLCWQHWCSEIERELRRAIGEECVALRPEVKAAP